MHYEAVSGKPSNETTAWNSAGLAFSVSPVIAGSLLARGAALVGVLGKLLGCRLSWSQGNHVALGNNESSCPSPVYCNAFVLRLVLSGLASNLKQSTALYRSDLIYESSISKRKNGPGMLFCDILLWKQSRRENGLLQEAYKFGFLQLCLVKTE